MNVLVTGSNGLIGSEAVLHYDRLGHQVHGIDNNLRQEFFGADGDTRWNLDRLKSATRHFTHLNWDIRERERLFDLFAQERFDLIIHCAAQPSHDKAAEIPLTDFEVNAVGTLNLLEATRQKSPDAVFIHLSTNKVYGDAPNELPLNELPTRWDYARPEDFGGIREDCRIDRTLHSIFGASKTAADVMAQEYGRYFSLKVGVFRCGCLTGENHSGARLHGFLSFLVKVAKAEQTYTVIGHKGKQVRDQIHSSDVIAAFDAFSSNPRPGEVYNLGGGRQNSVSVIEAIARVDELTGQRLTWRYEDKPRIGDHICYISDLGKFQSHYPQWQIRIPLTEILERLVRAKHDPSR